jgi:hypothetical protein
MDEKENEDPPILKKWRNVYILVIGTELAVIIILYLITGYFK